MIYCAKDSFGKEYICSQPMKWGKPFPNTEEKWYCLIYEQNVYAYDIAIEVPKGTINQILRVVPNNDNVLLCQNLK